MHSFFHGWRRKIGVVTLVMACVFMAGWVRSLTEFDGLYRPNEREVHVFTSTNGYVDWTRVWPIDIPRSPPQLLYRHHTKPDYVDPWEGSDIHWKYAALGFNFGAGSDKQTMRGNKLEMWIQEVEMWRVPYWSIVLPLTLLSVYLLLWRPRPKKTLAEST